MSRLGIWLLRRLARRRPETPQGSGQGYGDTADELSKVSYFLPWFPVLVKGCRVLDYGCGTGRQVLAMASAGAAEVIGLDIQTRVLAEARVSASDSSLAGLVSFTSTLSPDLEGHFDVVLSQNAMEHYTEPKRAVDEIYRALRPGGIAIFAWGPPWWHPYGAHVHYLTRIPWPQVFFSESTIMEVRGEYKGDRAESFEQIEGGLNRMTVSRFEDLIRLSNFRIVDLRFRTIRGVPLVQRLPLIREVLIADVCAVLRKPRATD